MEELLRAATTPGLAGAYHLEEMGATRTPAEGLRLGAAGCDTSVPMTTTPPEIPGNINLASEPAVSLESCFSPARFQQPVPTLSGELTPQGSRSHPDSLQPEVQLNGSNMMPQNMSQPETTPALHMSPATTTLIGDETINGSCMNRSSVCAFAMNSPTPTCQGLTRPYSAQDDQPGMIMARHLADGNC